MVRYIGSLGAKEFYKKNVLVRADLNVPIEEQSVLDNTKVKLLVRTVDFLKKFHAKIVLTSHLGDPSEKNKGESLRMLVPEIESLLNVKVTFVNDCIGENVKKAIEQADYGTVILLENLRFHAEEKKCDMDFAKHLSEFADFYVNEAFSASHRNHASIVGIPKFLPHAIGFSFQEEKDSIDNFFENSKSPRMCIIGGAKLSTKVKLLNSLVTKVDKLALGGGIAGAFLSFLGNKTLKIFDPQEYVKDVVQIMKNANDHNCEIIMPVDFSALITDEDALEHVIISDSLSKANVFDIGPNSVNLFKKHIEESAAVLWNGPVGLFEKTPFDHGTREIALAISEKTKAGKMISIAGGGDTVHALNKFGVTQDFSRVSCAGGAFLSYIEDNNLCAIKAMNGN